MLPPEEGRITQSAALLVEGRDEERFFAALLKHTGLVGVWVKGFGGRTNIEDGIAGARQLPGFEANVRSLGVERDANGDAQAAFQSVCGALQRSRLPVPARPMQTVREGGLRVTTMILPGAGEPGMLEDVCLRSLDGRPEQECVEGLSQCLGERGLPELRQPAKARAHAYLATQEKPGLRVGEAVEAGYWDFGHPAFDQMKHFLLLVAGEA